MHISMQVYALAVHAESCTKDEASDHAYLSLSCLAHAHTHTYAHARGGCLNKILCGEEKAEQKHQCEHVILTPSVIRTRNTSLVPEQSLQINYSFSPVQSLPLDYSRCPLIHVPRADLVATLDGSHLATYKLESLYPE